jgi:drug/metabolite transporter (DMT)-like permease
VLLYWCSISFYNFFGLSVANEFSSVHRTLIDASRTVFVWGIDLFIYYKIDSCAASMLLRLISPSPTHLAEIMARLGRRTARCRPVASLAAVHFLHHPLTHLQLGGFLLLITGVFAYNRVFKVPGFRYS